MATKKDLVEAYSFSRRRLVTAFVSGAPGGREVEPSRPGRTIVGGVALAVLLAAGAAIAGVFAPRTPDDWNQPGLIVSKETGAAYVILESDPDELRPVINTTSAKLILGESSEPTLISQDTIDEQHIGEDIGILGAPASVPTSSLLINSGWTACTGDERGIRTTVAQAPDVQPAPGSGITVESDGELFVVVSSEREPGGAQVFPVPPQESGSVRQTDVLLASLDLPSQQDAVSVPREWINLFPVGAALDSASFPVDGLGRTPQAELPAGAGDATIGTLLETADGDYFLVTDSGPVELTGFAAQVYRNVLVDGGDVARVLEVPSALGVDFGDNSFLARERLAGRGAGAAPGRAVRPARRGGRGRADRPPRRRRRCQRGRRRGRGRQGAGRRPGTRGLRPLRRLDRTGHRCAAVPDRRQGERQPARRQRSDAAGLRRRTGAGGPGHLGGAVRVRGDPLAGRGAAAAGHRERAQGATEDSAGRRRLRRSARRRARRGRRRAGPGRRPGLRQPGTRARGSTSTSSTDSTSGARRRWPGSRRRRRSAWRCSTPG